MNCDLTRRFKYPNSLRNCIGTSDVDLCRYKRHKSTNDHNSENGSHALEDWHLW